MGETDPRVEIVARVLDHPSVYMGGPSRRSMRTARIILDTLDAARPVEPQPEYDASDAIDRAIRNWSTISDEPLADEEVAAAARRLRKLASMNRDELGAKYDRRTADMLEHLSAEVARLTAEIDAVSYQYAHDIEALRARATAAGAEVESLTREREQWHKQAQDQLVRAERLEDYVERNDYIGGWRNRTTAAEAEVADLRAKLAKAVEALRAHHDWHQQIGVVLFPAEEGQTEPTEINLSVEYADSTLCEQTCAALANTEDRT